MSYELNERALQLIEDAAESAEMIRVQQHEVRGSGLLLDFGVEAEGGLEAGLLLADVCLCGLADVSLTSSLIGDLAWPHIQVWTDFPVPACLYSQYAGWQISVGKFFAMGSGPMRAVAAREELFQELHYREECDTVVGVLETAKLPKAEVFQHIAEQCRVEPEDVVLLAAPTSSLCGTVQVVSRSVETALHKLHELGFDVLRIRSGQGTAPLPPVAADDLQGIGRTNDAILYGGRVTLWATGDDESIATLIEKVPSSGSSAHGRPFLEVFEAAGRDFYQIDPHLFSPAEVVIHNLDTGRVHRAGRTAPEILRQSFGV